MEHLRKNTRLLYAVNLFYTAWFHLPVMVLFGTQYLGFSFAETGALIWVRWCAAMLFDFVGGVMADRFGRKRVFGIGITLEIFSFLSLAVLTDFKLLLLGAIVCGLGKGLQGNSLDALFYDQANKLGAKTHYTKFIASSQMFGYMGRAGASILGGLAYVVTPILPFLLTAAALAVAMVLGITTTFPCQSVRSQSSHKTSLKMIKTTLRLYRHDAILRRYLLAAGLMEIGSEALFNYCQPFYISLQVSSQTIGFIMAGVAFTSGVSSLLIRKLARYVSPQLVLVGIVALNIPTLLGMFIFPTPYVFLAPISMAIGFGLAVPNMRLLVNAHAPSDVRASTLSVATTSVTFAAVTGMCLLYFLIDHVPTPVVLTAISGIVGFALIVSLWEWYIASVRRLNASVERLLSSTISVHMQEQGSYD